MMPDQTDVIVDVSHVWKRFSLKLKQVSLRQEALSFFSAMLKQRAMRASSSNVLWALKDVSFQIKTGETVAIVGKNGAGKTTLLRLLANILAPTQGVVDVRGRFTALISLGAGFIPLMTGRENIYLNAAMYGVRPSEVEDVIEEIIAFADIGQFIDVPVKDYSSGMNARLGFSIAIHIAADIVFIDEVLSVGDAAFRAKCERKIQELHQKARTFILVSHSESDIRQMSERVLLLHRGELIADGPTDDVLKEYNRL